MISRSPHGRNSVEACFAHAFSIFMLSDSCPFRAEKQRKGKSTNTKVVKGTQITRKAQQHHHESPSQHSFQKVRWLHRTAQRLHASSLTALIWSTPTTGLKHGADDIRCARVCTCQEYESAEDMKGAHRCQVIQSPGALIHHQNVALST
jgi:hypothetical protein